MFENRLKELGIEIPEAPKPLAAYVPAVRSGNLIYTSGQLPLINGELKYTGAVGKDISEEDAKKAAEICALNCLGAIKSILTTLDKIEQIIKLTVFVNSAEGFQNQPVVANGASEIIGKIFSDNGLHARSAVGVNNLPKNASVEVEMIVRVNEL
jgi:enamine deaminase RidA (YjgF/YER057c/UK114 family)